MTTPHWGTAPEPDRPPRHAVAADAVVFDVAATDPEVPESVAPAPQFADAPFPLPPPVQAPAATEQPAPQSDQQSDYQQPDYQPPQGYSYAPRVPQYYQPSTASRRRDWRASGRRVLSQLVGLHTSRDVREYLDLHRQLTTAVTSGRRIVVLSVEPAQGSTTVAALLATALATRRADPVLLVDAAAISPNPLHRTFQTAPVRTIRGLANQPPRIRSRAEFDQQLTPVGRDVWLVPGDDLVGRSGLHAPDAATYTAAVAPFTRYFDITITDLGCAPGEGTAELLLNRAHALCLITPATRLGFEAVTSRLRQLRDNMGMPWAGRTIVVANRPRPDQGPSRWSGDALRVHSRDIPVVHVAYDANLGPGFPGRLAELAPETHLAAMRLAGDVLDTAVPTAPPGAPAVASGVMR